MKPPVQYAMMPPRADAPKVGRMKPVEPPKVAKMRGFDAALDYYLGPTGIPDRLRALNSMLNPVETLGGSMRASQRMLAPDTAPMDRVQAAGDMLSGVAGFAAPMVAASKLGAPAASAVAEAFTGLSTGARKAGATVVDRLNQPGPMPTLYSNPIPGLMGPKKGIRAYHGSPHSFDKFDMGKIGTGEGAQAYGRGLYFAESEGVARGYRNRLTQGDVNLLLDGKPVDFGKLSTPEMMAVSALKDARGNPTVAKEILSADGWDSAFGLVDSFAPRIKADGPGSMYEVQINADPDTFLDWDKPLSAQPQKVRDALAPLGFNLAPQKMYDVLPDAEYRDLLEQKYGVRSILDVPQEKWSEAQDLALRPTQSVNDLSGQRVIEQLSGGDANYSEAATAALRERGIPGIKYLDAGSRGVGNGSRNYVVFSDDLIQIVRKYGIAGLMMAGLGGNSATTNADGL